MRKTCLETVFELAKTNKKVVFIGSDLGPGVLDNFKKKFPDRFFMEGVAEQAIIGMSAGLAMQKFRPYVNTIATFITRRCFEQVVIDLCLHNLPVTLIGNGDKFSLITKMIKDYELNNRIFLKGKITDNSNLAEEYNKAIISVSLGQAGLSVLQSFGFGVPFLTKNNRGRNHPLP